MADILGEKKKTSITSLNKTSKVYVYNVVTKEWRSRTCELNGSYLSFYRKEKIVAVIDLEQVGDISPVTDIPQDDIIKETVFTISLKEDRNFMIRTISSDECISWICILQEVRDKLRSQLSRKSNVSVTSSSHNTFDRLMSSDAHDSAIDNGSSDKIEDYFDNEVKLDGNILSPIPISQENSAVGAKNKPAAGSVVNNIKKRFSFGTALSSTFSMGSIGSPNNLISSPQARRVSFSFPMTDKQLIPPPLSSSSISKCKIKCNESALHGNNKSINANKANSISAKADGPHGKVNTTVLVPSNLPLDNSNQKAIVSVLSPADNKKRSDATKNNAVDENKENMHVNTQSEDKSPSTVVGSSHMMSPKNKLLLLNESVEVTPTHSSTVVVVEHQKGNEVHATVASISTSPMNISCIDASHRLIAPRVNARAPNYRTPERKTSFVNRTSLGTQTPNFRRPLKAPYQSCFDVWTSSIPLSYVIMMVAVAVFVGSFISSFYITQHYDVVIRNGQLITAGNTASSATINLLPTIQPSVAGSSMDHFHHGYEANAKTKVDFENNSPFARNLRQVQAKSSSISSTTSSTIIKGSSALTPLDAADIGSSSSATATFDQLVSRPRAEVVSQQIKPSTSPLQVLFQVLRDSFRLLSDIKGRIMSFFSLSRVAL